MGRQWEIVDSEGSLEPRRKEWRTDDRGQRTPFPATLGDLGVFARDTKLSAIHNSMTVSRRDAGTLDRKNRCGPVPFCASASGREIQYYCAKQTQFHTVQNHAKQTQFPEGSGLRGQRPDTRYPTPGPWTFAPNKANSSHVGRKSHWLPGPQVLPPGNKCAKQTQFVPNPCERQVPCAKEVMSNWSAKGRRKNKANSCTGGRGQGWAWLPGSPATAVVQTNPIFLAPVGRGTARQGRKRCRRWGKRAKQSQLSPGVRKWARTGRAGRRPPPRVNCAKQSQKSVAGRKAAVQTKPIGEGIRFRGSGIGKMTSETRPMTPGLSRETKPIAVGAELKLSYVQEKSYVARTCFIGSAKQSQFPLRRRFGDRRSREAKRAKQSQFWACARASARWARGTSMRTNKANPWRAE